jgi:hypothetical protein
MAESACLNANRLEAANSDRFLRCDRTIRLAAVATIAVQYDKLDEIAHRSLISRHPS